jgi:hypothetical protein
MPDIWMRRHFDLTEVPVDGQLFLELHHDEDAEIFLNGKQVKTVAGYVTRYLNLPLDATAVTALRQGRNTIAVHCHNATGGQYIDLGLVVCRTNGRSRDVDAAMKAPRVSARSSDASENRGKQAAGFRGQNH